MEKYNMFMDWKNQCSENEYTIQSNLQIQCNPYQANSGIFHSNFLECYKNFPQFIVIHTVKGFGIVNKVEIDVFLELSCFFYDPVDVGNLISGSSAFSKMSLNIWTFTVHVLLKLGL